MMGFSTLTRSIAAAASVFALGTSCSETKKSAPEPTSGNVLQGANTQVIQMPDGFRNVVATMYVAPDGSCYMIFVTSRGPYKSGNADASTLPSSIAVVPCSAKVR